MENPLHRQEGRETLKMRKEYYGRNRESGEEKAIPRLIPILEQPKGGVWGCIGGTREEPIFNLSPVENQKKGESSSKERPFSLGKMGGCCQGGTKGPKIM